MYLSDDYEFTVTKEYIKFILQKYYLQSLLYPNFEPLN